MEREAAYKDASENYQKAWLYGNKNSPNIGKVLKLKPSSYLILYILIIM